MAFGDWFPQNWFNIITSLGVIASLWYTADAARKDTKSRQLGNLLVITNNHREIWTLFLSDPKLARVLDQSPNLENAPVTAAEGILVNMVILNMSNYFYAMNDGMVVRLDGLRRDVAGFFSYPIVVAVWEKTKTMQNDDFVRFVEACRNWK